jgi:hypothetical protein
MLLPKLSAHITLLHTPLNAPAPQQQPRNLMADSGNLLQQQDACARKRIHAPVHKKSLNSFRNLRYFVFLKVCPESGILFQIRVLQ